MPGAGAPEVRLYAPGDEDGIRDVMETALGADRYPGVSQTDIDRAVPRLRGDPGGTAVALEAGRIVGYVTPRGDDLTVHPAFRRRGHGRRLVAAGRAIVRGRGGDELRLYVPPHLPASVAFAEALGFRHRSSLWLFELDGAAEMPSPRFPSAVTVRALRPDEDLTRYVTFMNEAFSGHPTPMSWTVEGIRHVHGLADFDPSFVLLAEDGGPPHDLVGFAVLEVYPPDDAGRRSGSVGLVGVVPAWRGRGLGRELLRWAVTDLRRRGIERIDLSVEAENERATRLYRAHGFRPSIEWPHWGVPALEPGGGAFATPPAAGRAPADRSGSPG